MSLDPTEEFTNFDATLSMESPVSDYLRLVEDKLKTDHLVPDKVLTKCFERISASTREMIWKLLFGTDDPLYQPRHWYLASQLLQEHKGDACFYNPWPYNDWIVKVRDELLRRNMIDFWREEIVKKELGPCWARDSDLFDDRSDVEPANFYRYAGCEPNWIDEPPVRMLDPTVIPTCFTRKGTTLNILEQKFRKLSLETPLQDYKYNIKTQNKYNSEDSKAYRKILQEAREMIWHLVFDYPTLEQGNALKATELLIEVKMDSCYYRPFDYNAWIVLFRNELLTRKFYDFWKNVIVANKLGLCSSKDSDYFDADFDTNPDEFYQYADDIIKADNKK